MSIPVIKTSKDTVGFYFDSKMHSIDKTHPNFDKIVESLKNNNVALLRRLVDIPKAVERFCSTSNCTVRVENGNVIYNGKVVDNTLTKRIVALMGEGFGFENMMRFMENIQLNPSHRSVNELYDFLDHFALPITEDGCFLAYKAIRNNYYSKQAGVNIPIQGKILESSTGSGIYYIYNGVGEIIELNRNEVDDARENGCSNGLHCGAIGYVKSYGNIVESKHTENGDRIVIVKVNPKDVVSVPSDCNCEKIRVCKYVVVCEMQDYTELLTKAVYTSTGEECDLFDDDVSDHECDCPCDDEECNCGECDCNDDNKKEVEVDEELQELRYIKGYKAGYRKGKGHRVKEYTEDSKGSGISDDYIDGYITGYKHGRNNLESDPDGAYEQHCRIDEL